MCVRLGKGDGRYFGISFLTKLLTLARHLLIKAARDNHLIRKQTHIWIFLDDFYPIWLQLFDTIFSGTIIL